jgi:hypothetical protein
MVSGDAMPPAVPRDRRSGLLRETGIVGAGRDGEQTLHRLTRQEAAQSIAAFCAVFRQKDDMR